MCGLNLDLILSEKEKMDQMQENQLLTDKHYLLAMGCNYDLLAQFCGKIITQLPIGDSDQIWMSDPHVLIYACGNIADIYPQIPSTKKLLVIRELSHQFEGLSVDIISVGQVPLNVHNAGVYFPRFFLSASEDYYFRAIHNEHQFQSLTESNKPNQAFRKGIYLSKVETAPTSDERIVRPDSLIFNLLRCSSNLGGPTDNFRPTDYAILQQLNIACADMFRDPTDMNHVLAQVYINNTKGKAKISTHSDKTKDMSKKGLIAFCTFYDGLKELKPSPENPYDYLYNKTSGLTKLRFRLKHDVVGLWVKEFDVTLYPNSVFIIPLSTNRIYTHEIKPSNLPFEKIPTRMGYVVRSSNVKACSMGGETYIEEEEKLTKMEPITEETRDMLKRFYFEENTTSNVMEYPPLYFSMNDGDYIPPKA